MASDRLRKLQNIKDEEPAMDMSAMIDMVFLLLIFFIVVSTPMVVKMDDKVKPAIAAASKDADTKHGRIVINIRADGTVTKENFKNDDGTLNKLDTDDQITEYVRELKEEIIRQGHVPKLHLRGDQGAVFKHSRRVIKAAAGAGVERVVFAVYPHSKNK